MLKLWKGSTRFGYFNGLIIPNYTLANSINNFTNTIVPKKWNKIKYAQRNLFRIKWQGFEKCFAKLG